MNWFDSANMTKASEKDFLDGKDALDESTPTVFIIISSWDSCDPLIVLLVISSRLLWRPELLSGTRTKLDWVPGEVKHVAG